MSQIKVIIKPGQSPLIEVNGVQGEACHNVSQPFIDAAGHEEECNEKEQEYCELLPDYVEE